MERFGPTKAVERTKARSWVSTAAAAKALPDQSAYSNSGDRSQQKYDWIDWLAIAKRSMGDAVNHGKDNWVSRQRKTIGAVTPKKRHNACESANSRYRSVEERSANQPGICSEEGIDSERRSHPKSREPIREQKQYLAWMSQHKELGLAPLLIHKRDFAHVGIAHRFALFRDGRRKSRMIISVVFIVADVELERKIRA